LAENLDEQEIHGMPKHIAIIMDGNGRWATKRKRPRSFGHKAGVDSLKKTIECCIKNNISTLTVFAFSSENWSRPKKEVDLLMGLFSSTLDNQAKKMIKNNIRLSIIGDRSAFSKTLRDKIKEVELLTKDCTGLHLVIAANYGGQWDIDQATQAMLTVSYNQDLSPEQFADLKIEDYLSTRDLIDPDLFIRTGGEKRISNYLLWPLAYTELYFTDVLWPDFDENEFNKAVKDFSLRQRRFGRTGEQIIAC